MNIYSLDRFLEAQERMYETSLMEITNGKKRSHWMWYIFPQMRGLGSSDMSYCYGISDLQEARDYLAHPVLYDRLTEICEALLEHEGKEASDIFGYIDDMKLKSSMTLFALVSNEESVFHQVLDCFFEGEMDENTLELVGLL